MRLFLTKQEFPFPKRSPVHGALNMGPYTLYSRVIHSPWPRTITVTVTVPAFSQRATRFNTARHESRGVSSLRIEGLRKQIR
jgi:hypothetical protein